MLFFFTKHIVMKTKIICIDSLKPQHLEIKVGDRVKVKSRIILKVVDFDVFADEHDVITCKAEASDATITVRPAEVIEIIKDVVEIVEQSQSLFEKIAGFWQKIKKYFSKT